MDGKRCKFADPVHNGYHCGSYAFNLAQYGIKQGNYCDVHYWQRKCEKVEAKLAALSQPAAQGDSSHPAGGECGGVPAPTVWGIDYMGEPTADFFLDRANAEAAIAYRNRVYPNSSALRSVAAYVKATP